MIRIATLTLCLMATGWYIYDEFFVGDSVLKIAHFKKKLIPIYSLHNAMVHRVNVDNHQQLDSNTLLFELDSSNIIEEMKNLTEQNKSLHNHIDKKMVILKLEKANLKSYAFEAQLIIREIAKYYEQSQNYKKLYKNQYIGDQEILELESNIRKQEMEQQKNIRAKQVSTQIIAQLKMELNDFEQTIERNTRRLEYLPIELNKYKIKMPESIQVKEVFVQPGQTVREGDLLALLFSQKNYWVEANIKESNLKNIKINSQVKVQMDSLENRMYSGKIRSIAPATESEVARSGLGHLPNYRKYQQRLIIIIELNDPEHSLAEYSSGLSATVYL